MRNRKTLQELTLKDNFLFAAVMMEPENCKGFLEMLLRGTPYEQLPDSYVIFICDFDPFGAGKYIYTIDRVCREVPGLNYRDGCHSIFLSTEGTNADEISETLAKFLRFVKADLAESMLDYDDAYIKSLQRSIRQIKQSREMGEHFIVFEEMMREEHEQGKAEGKVEGKAELLLDVLSDVGEVPQELRDHILEIRDTQILKKLLREAVNMESPAQFSHILEVISN